MGSDNVLRSRFPRFAEDGDTCTLTIDDVWILPLKLTVAINANNSVTALLQELLLSNSIHANVKLVSSSANGNALCYLIFLNQTAADEAAEKIEHLQFENEGVLKAVKPVSQEEWCITLDSP